MYTVETLTTFTWGGGWALLILALEFTSVSPQCQGGRGGTDQWASWQQAAERRGYTKRPEHFSNDGLSPKAPPSAFHHLLIMSSGSVRALIC